MKEVKSSKATPVVSPLFKPEGQRIKMFKNIGNQSNKNKTGLSFKNESAQLINKLNKTTTKNKKKP